MISIIIPAKELNELLYKTVCNYKITILYEYEIIIVYDYTSDNIYNKFTERFKGDNSVILLSNKLKGRILKSPCFVHFTFTLSY